MSRVAAKRIAIASDHAGFALKSHLIAVLESQGYHVEDYGTHSTEATDYPHLCAAAARAVRDAKADVGIVLGEALKEALGDKAGVRRFASGSFPLDEALVAVALDLSGRPFVAWNVELPECLPLGNPAFDPSLAEHAISSLATAANITLHVNLLAGRNVHHIIEASFKGLARCLRDAVRIESAGVPSTKGVLS